MARTMRVFTHPACSGCGPVVKMCWELAQSDDQLELLTIALETKKGLAEAQRYTIRTIPTVIVFDGDVERHRLVGTPTRDELHNAVMEIVA